MVPAAKTAVKKTACNLFILLKFCHGVFQYYVVLIVKKWIKDFQWVILSLIAFPNPVSSLKYQTVFLMSFCDISTMISSAPVVLFIKGTAEHPMCGFSRVVVRILNHLNVPFSSFDVLQDPDLRQNLKAFSNWPTFPQLYVSGELIGGCDIAQEMFQSGELAQVLAPYVEKVSTGVVS